MLVGVSTETIKKAEQGPRNLAGEVALRIISVTGVHPDELNKGKGGQALNALGEPYTREWFERVWCRDWNPVEDDKEMLKPIEPESIIDLESLCKKLKSAHPQDRFSRYIESRLAPSIRRGLAEYNGSDDKKLKQELARDLTRLMWSEDFNKQEPILGVTLSATTNLKEAPLRDFLIKMNRLVILNRLLLEDAYPDESDATGPSGMRLAITRPPLQTWRGSLCWQQPAGSAPSSRPFFATWCRNWITFAMRTALMGDFGRNTTRRVQRNADQRRRC